MITLILGAIAGVFALFGIKKAGQSAISMFKTDPKVKIANDLIENHEVANKEAAAKTDGEVDAALALDAKSDHT